MLLSGTAARFAVVDAEGAAVSAGFDGVRRDQKNAPIASRTSATATPTIRASFSKSIFVPQTAMRLLVPCRHKPLGHFGIAKLGGVKVNHRNVGALFHFGLTKIVQMFVPVAKLFQVFRDVFGKQDVLGVPAIHHPLGNVDAGAGDVGASAHIHPPLTGPL